MTTTKRESKPLGAAPRLLISAGVLWTVLILAFLVFWGLDFASESQLWEAYESGTLETGFYLISGGFLFVAALQGVLLIALGLALRELGRLSESVRRVLARDT